MERDIHVLWNGVVFEKRISPTLRMKDVYADRKKTKDNDE
jgi:hypothetical protein